MELQSFIDGHMAELTEQRDDWWNIDAEDQPKPMKPDVKHFKEEL